ncbi:rab9 effector protein with kelch motifs-like [Octopus vulgaris]|uniref:Rab9 effector protein with kelch motifs n=1 Tax=Octopus vulgaris TaxID=6645 RepID=A0AA36FGV3_OCTVU|nr:rab9 effector protein with kelch motifs-like [Octopus vulgaris]
MEILPYFNTNSEPVAFVWYLLETSGDAPKCRVGHSACVVKPSNSEAPNNNGQLYLIGGANPDNTFSDNPILDLNSWQWGYKEFTGFVPRYEQSLFSIRNNSSSLYIFGGANQTDTLNDIQYLDTDASKWLTLTPKGDIPVPRTHHSTTSVDDQFVVFGGGAQGTSPVLDAKVHSFSVPTSTWSTLDIKGPVPKPRLGHISVSIDKKVYIHGGLCEDKFFDDFHVLDLETESWQQLEVSGQHPSARAAHGAVANGDNIYIFGGMSVDGALNDFYQVDTASLISTRIAVDAPAPRPRLDFAMTITEITLDQPQSQRSGSDVENLEPSEDHEESTQEELQASNGCESVENVECSSRETYTVCLIHGGMDTEGGIFNDTLVIFLS